MHHKLWSMTSNYGQLLEISKKDFLYIQPKITRALHLDANVIFSVEHVTLHDVIW